MVQNNMGRLGNRPQTKPDHRECCHHGEVASCVEKECTCGCGCERASSMLKIFNGVLSFLGCCAIAATLRLNALEVRNARPLPQPKPQPTAQLPDIDKAIEKYINKNTKVLVEALTKYSRAEEAKARREAPARFADKAMLDEIINDKTNNVLGNKNGPFIFIEFFDYNCGYCKRMNKAMAEAVKKSKNIRWILMDAPIFGEASEVIARYAYAAAQQGKFAEFHEALADQNADKTENGLKEIGKKLGLNVEKLAQVANSDEAKAKLQKNRVYTTKLQLGGVPMFIINGKIQPGAFSDEQMAEYIKQADAMQPAPEAKPVEPAKPEAKPVKAEAKQPAKQAKAKTVAKTAKK